VVARLALAVLLTGTTALAAVPQPRVLATVQVGGQPTWLAAGAGSVWVANYGSGEVERVDPARNRVSASGRSASRRARW
jgi:DNA-binding beta-propeller fold protein YncE